jgi:RNA polymerase sigma-54 factor
MLKNIQTLQQQQKLSPQAIQAQLLLAIPTLSLDQEIKNQMEENPLLEEDKEVSAEASVNAPEQYTFDSGSYNRTSEYSKSITADKTDYLLNKGERPRETPIEQIYKLGLDDNQRLIAEEILGNVDDDGYLRITFEDIRNDINDKYSFRPDDNEIESVLKSVQKLDPIGIASRNLQECLTVQLEELGIDQEDKSLCIRMINDYFDDFKHKHFEKLAKFLSVQLEKINELFEIIQRLNPVPGKLDTAADYIYPDFMITEIDGKLIAELNNDYKPSVKISKTYVELYNSPDTPADTKEFLKNKLDSAKWFINAIQSRRDTLLKVMNAILERQRAFFETHGEKLKPMFEKDIAEDISMDISTISRAVRGKYVQTDFGIFELKYFFSASVQTDAGEDVSNKVVKERIRDLIEKEDKAKPLSDDKLTDIMNNYGFPIARRTVAKYREAMKIPKATLRRKLLL